MLLKPLFSTIPEIMLLKPMVLEQHVVKLIGSTTFPKKHVARTNGAATFPTTMLLEPFVLQHFPKQCC